MFRRKTSANQFPKDEENQLPQSAHEFTFPHTSMDYALKMETAASIPQNGYAITNNDESQKRFFAGIGRNYETRECGVGAIK